MDTIYNIQIIIYKPTKTSPPKIEQKTSTSAYHTNSDNRGGQLSQPRRGRISSIGIIKEKPAGRFNIQVTPDTRTKNRHGNTPTRTIGMAHPDVQSLEKQPHSAT